jgi:hypothetical protein
VLTANKHSVELRWGLAGALLLVAGWWVFFLDAATVTALTREDGPVEYLGMLCWFAAAGASFLAFFRSERGVRIAGWKTRRNWFFVLLGILFVFAGGEEISWGQRIFGFDTPDAWRELNLQSEFNVHNLPIFNAKDAENVAKTGFARWISMERMFAVFWLSYCFLFPIAVRSLGVMRKPVEALNVPVPPVLLGSMFMLNYGIHKALEVILRDSPGLHWPNVEMKESLFAALFLLVALYFLRPRVAARSQGVPAN